MSFSNLSTLGIAVLAVLMILMHTPDLRAQSARSSVKIIASQNSEVRIQIKVGSPVDQWSFLNAYAGALGLGERIKQFEAFSSKGVINSKRIASGEFRADRPVDNLSYTVQLSTVRPGDLAHISWLNRDSGLLMLSDLLPEALLNEQVIDVTVEVPSNLRVESAFSADAQGRFNVTNPDKAVFFVGDKFDVQSKGGNGTSAKVVLAGKWSFSGKEVLKSATRILDWYDNLTGSRLKESAVILIGPLPPNDSDSKWKAETRGSTTILLLNPRVQVKNWIGQIGIILTHELFHLWVPNSLSFTGDYDWFFEGFTLYVALQAALKLKLINFREYLDTLARVYDSYLSYTDEQSLIEASERRWTSSVPVVYDKGMLVAFIYDLTIRRASGGSTSLLDSYRTLFGSHTGERSDANDVIIKLLTSTPATEALARSYIRGRERLELEKIVPTFGFQLSVDGPKSRLSVSKDLDDSQKHLLGSLGYRK